MTGENLNDSVAAYFFARRNGQTPEGRLTYPDGRPVPHEEHPDLRPRPFTDLELVFHLPGTSPRHLRFSATSLHLNNNEVGGIFLWKNRPTR